ncbi:alpha/beta hydrolase [Pontimonas sp.]|nr:alpha/beta hydrolase [Pontimonas sp.]|tara:strand:+ start:856 stop:1575 length:720 start_codon:yes stop_codon:yes gene_type:complete
MSLITSTTVLPALRSDIGFTTVDGLELVGEISVPESHPALATAVFLHPLPTAGGFMDSHVIRKAAWRLPALADIAVLRFNFRGVSSPRGTSEGVFGEGITEGLDLEAALGYLHGLSLPRPWLIGWSFGTEVILKHARALVDDIAGVILLSPPLHRTSKEELRAWADVTLPVVALVPEFDEFLTPEQALLRFAVAPNVEVVAAEGAKHLWVGEKQTKWVLDQIALRLNPPTYPLPVIFGV